VVKGNDGGRREAADRDNGECRAAERDRDERRRERGEREDNPLFSSPGCDSERRRYLDQSNHAAGSAFYHYFTCFPFTSPSLDDIPRAISWDKKDARSQKRTPCFLPASDVFRCPPGVYLGPADASSGRVSTPAALADLLAACLLHVQSLAVEFVRDVAMELCRGLTLCPRNRTSRKRKAEVRKLLC
jgi:hypothetical protein